MGPKRVPATHAARRQLSKVDEVVGGAIARIEEALAPLEDRLPAPAKETVQKVRDAGKGLHAKVQVKIAELDSPATTRTAKVSKATKPTTESDTA